LHPEGIDHNRGGNNEEGSEEEPGESQEEVKERTPSSTFS